MLRELSSKQIADWMAYDALEPFGHRAADMSAAIIAHAIHNRWRSKDEPPRKLNEFRQTHVESEPDEPDPAVVWAQLETALGAFPRMVKHGSN